MVDQLTQQENPQRRIPTAGDKRHKNLWVVRKKGTKKGKKQKRSFVVVFSNFLHCHGSQVTANRVMKFRYCLSLRCETLSSSFSLSALWRQRFVYFFLPPPSFFFSSINLIHGIDGDPGTPARTYDSTRVFTFRLRGTLANFQQLAESVQHPRTTSLICSEQIPLTTGRLF